MPEKGDLGNTTRKTPAELAREEGYSSTRFATKIPKGRQLRYKRNADLMEEFLKGAAAGQRERQEADRET